MFMILFMYLINCVYTVQVDTSDAVQAVVDTININDNNNDISLENNLDTNAGRALVHSISGILKRYFSCIISVFN